MDELLGIAICLGIFLVSVILPVWLGLMSRQSNALQSVGNRYGGRTSTDHAFSRARLRFQYGNSKVDVRFCRRLPSSGGRQTEIRISVPLDSIKMEAISQMGRSRYWWMGREQTWKSGDDAFDSLFQVLTNQPTAADGILTPTIRWQMIQLCQLGKRGLYLSIFENELIMASPKFMTRGQLLDDFVRLSLELYDQLMLAKAVGIDFVENQTAVIDEVKCPICTCDIDETMVVCLRCRTPHCLECWRYNGKCATFACGETRFVYPVATSPPESSTERDNRRIR